jgi:hypothetical protein
MIEKSSLGPEIVAEFSPIGERLDNGHIPWMRFWEVLLETVKTNEKF